MLPLLPDLLQVQLQVLHGGLIAVLQLSFLQSKALNLESKSVSGTFLVFKALQIDSKLMQRDGSLPFLIALLVLASVLLYLLFLKMLSFRSPVL